MFDTKLFEECLVRYKEAFENRFFNNEKEKYKWEAIKWFQDHWNINAENFYSMFTLATEKTYNLLASMNNFPRGVIQVFAEQEPESVRAMFLNLYDENKDVAERILKFQSDAQELGDRLLPGKQHYQRPMAISVYLWLHDPEKYCIYKYTAFRNASIYLGNDYIPKKGNPIQNIRENQEFVENIRKIISNDKELVARFRDALDEKCYDDPNLLTLANDLEIFISLEYVDGNGQWLAQNYSSGLNKEDWKVVLENDEIFDLKSQKILARMLDFGGQATCSQLAEKYGEDFSFYNFGSTAFAKKVAKETNCKLWIDEKGKENYWSLLYIGRPATKEENGVFVWKLRDELRDALLETDLSEVKLYEQEKVSVAGGLTPYTRDNFLGEVYMTSERYDTLRELLKKKKNIILQGAPGVGKTFTAKRLAYSIMGYQDDERVEFIQFHQNYSYEDFIMGYKPSGDSFELETGIFYDFCLKAAADKTRDYFFIIDEINRGNMSKIFGELLMLIEADYRGKEAKLAYNKKPFSVPKNIYIIGMMNTADRSLAMIDYALRRRFSFFTMEPGFISEGFQNYQKSFGNDMFDALIERIKELNLEITKDSSLGSGFCIGHSYFCGQDEVTEEWMQSVVEYDIIPMLEEYWFDESAKLQKWVNILRGVFND